jgi:predicted nucleic acid-binding protein
MSDDLIARLRLPEETVFPAGTQIAIAGGTIRTLEPFSMWSSSSDRQEAAAEIERLRARVAVLAIDRRERIATACLAGLLADPNVNDVSVTDTAVRFADALIARLDKEVKP